MRRREFILLLGGAAAWPLAARAQQPKKLPRIGVLVSALPPHPFADAFRRGLRSFGYIEGQNITIEFLYTGGRGDRAMEFAAELVRSGVDIIVAHFTPAARAAIAATRTIPIVMAPAGAPLQQGLIDSLARPSGNVTGLSAMDAEIGGKRLQLLRELMPTLSALGFSRQHQPQTAVTAKYSWKTCIWQPRKPILNSCPLWSMALASSRGRSKQCPRPERRR